MYRFHLVSLSAISLISVAASGVAFSSDSDNAHQNHVVFSTSGASSEWVSTDAESLLAADGSVLPSDRSYLDVKNFLTCFVANLDLPTQVYLDCGKALVQSAVNCRKGFLNFECITAVVGVANTCALPVSRAVEGAKTCWVEQNPGKQDE